MHVVLVAGHQVQVRKAGAGAKVCFSLHRDDLGGPVGRDARGHRQDPVVLAVLSAAGGAVGQVIGQGDGLPLDINVGTGRRREDRNDEVRSFALGDLQRVGRGGGPVGIHRDVNRGLGSVVVGDHDRRVVEGRMHRIPLIEVVGVGRLQLHGHLAAGVDLRAVQGSDLVRGGGLARREDDGLILGSARNVVVAPGRDLEAQGHVPGLGLVGGERILRVVSFNDERRVCGHSHVGEGRRPQVVVGDGQRGHVARRFRYRVHPLARHHLCGDVAVLAVHVVVPRRQLEVLPGCPRFHPHRAFAQLDAESIGQVAADVHGHVDVRQQLAVGAEHERNRLTLPDNRDRHALAREARRFAGPDVRLARHDADLDGKNLHQSDPVRAVRFKERRGAVADVGLECAVPPQVVADAADIQPEPAVVQQAAPPKDFPVNLDANLVPAEAVDFHGLDLVPRAAQIEPVATVQLTDGRAVFVALDAESVAGDQVVGGRRGVLAGVYVGGPDLTLDHGDRGTFVRRRNVAPGDHRERDLNGVALGPGQAVILDGDALSAVSINMDVVAAEAERAATQRQQQERVLERVGVRRVQTESQRRHALRVGEICRICVGVQVIDPHVIGVVAELCRA